MRQDHAGPADGGWSPQPAGHRPPCGYQLGGECGGRHVDIEELYNSVGTYKFGKLSLAELTQSCHAIKGPGVGAPDHAPQIAHAIRFTVDCTTDDFIWPARHEAGVSDPDCPPMGARFRLAADYDLSGFSPKARVILRAMKRYGLLLADNGSNWYFQGTSEDGWDTDMLDELKSIPAGAFEAVDASSLMSMRSHTQPGCARKRRSSYVPVLVRRKTR